jgi:divalent metal cation (Fe/Co/Zn/Cd) transporter
MFLKKFLIRCKNMEEHKLFYENKSKITGKDKLINIAIILSLITIFYNILEGMISIFFGIKDETLSLFGFGVDSFVEVISGIGIFHLTIRMKRNPVNEKDRFEQTALLITGVSFLLLFVGLIVGAINNLIYKNKPETTIAGAIIAIISILTMWILYKSKLYAGKKLDSDAIISDAKCTITCFYLSIILLLSSIIYEIFKIGYIDIIGSLGIAIFSLKEGIEAINKSRTKRIACLCD